MTHWHLGIIGGSGLYALDALENPRWVTVETPWGAPSDAVLTGSIAGIPLAFLPRHGRGHRVPPHLVNARANIDTLKRLGCTDVLAVSAVGSLSEVFAPGEFVAVDQIIDRTRARPSTFFESGLVAHVPMADPVCPRLTGLALAAARAAGATVHSPATYLTMEGPQFSTRAESRLYRSWGAGVIGMTAMPEAKLAREAELPYALLAMVTDYDCWHDGGDVDVSEILRVMAGNADTARAAIVNLVRNLPAERPASPIDTILDTAIITAPDARDPAAIARLDAILARVSRC
ncbi:S-methyl-5'-thioadenosine phosphorylase [Polymorphobacter fuscus]|uniref:S-methyl-5'-thioadenosine phosphorylase n=1 Tax=Sandarakinorhabdus fusca TaxID=1439888 RepID=A0A7C9KNN5_9SPHN|nr:S-methyl-5'-thioadenosine phosphorylase [Polymorphobacter fuscus]KAB7645442.1 S-methyl-5'-thioadenosine phosphorylase [Polymorphobacter fuscus]MQT17864.1 S-methyl-5'-thioadenosine phosphorylase [Polymorphobacter fuscus]NJC08493.1 5'-methylthioadenosine phosphorylase [Polymorphobacter fuscus]